MVNSYSKSIVYQNDKNDDIQNVQTLEVHHFKSFNFRGNLFGTILNYVSNCSAVTSEGQGTLVARETFRHVRYANCFTHTYADSRPWRFTMLLVLDICESGPTARKRAAGPQQFKIQICGPSM